MAADPLHNERAFSLVVTALIEGATYLEAGKALGVTKQAVYASLKAAGQAGAKPWQREQIERLKWARTRRQEGVQCALAEINKLAEARYAETEACRVAR